MAKVLVLYKTPKSAEAFDKHYAAVHIPLAKKDSRPEEIRYQQGSGRNARRSERHPPGRHLAFQFA